VEQVEAETHDVYIAIARETQELLKKSAPQDNGHGLIKGDYCVRTESHQLTGDFQLKMKAARALCPGIDSEASNSLII